MQGLLDGLRGRAWIATALMGAFAAACASLHLALPTALAAGAIMMRKSEEEASGVVMKAPEPESEPKQLPAFRPAA
jgi:hypothetical protein